MREPNLPSFTFIPKPGELDRLVDWITSKWDHPSIERFRGGPWRIWVHGWHIHNFGAQNGSYSSLATQGDTPEEAAWRMISLGNKYPVIRGDNCEYGKCPHFTTTYDS